MRLLRVITELLISFFRLKEQSLTYKKLMLVVFLIINILCYITYGILSYFTSSYTWIIILSVAALLNLFILYLIRQKSSYKITSGIFITLYNVSMAYLVFDGGRYGYAYVWFYFIPMVNVVILGIKKGGVLSFVYAFYLLFCAMFPEDSFL